MHAGRDLDGAKALAENDVVVPGPARRRAGEKVELSFDLVRDVIARADDALRRSQEAEQAAEHEKRRKEELEALREARRKEEDERKTEQQRRADWLAGPGPDLELDEYLQQRLRPGDPPPEQQLPPAGGAAAAEQPRHDLGPCSSDVRAAVEELFRRSCAPEARVLRIYRNHNPVLLWRYERARTALQEARVVSWTKRHEAATSKALRGMGNGGTVGAYDASVNEYPLWHGTPSADSAAGICSTGFDISRAGKVGTAWSPGFYFADHARTSHRYTQVWGVNEKYRNVRVMLLCRVLCGKICITDTPPTEQRKEALTSMCLGPGGAFGAQSEFHSILGGGWAHVCLHRDQVYPEFMVVYSC